MRKEIKYIHTTKNHNTNASEAFIPILYNKIGVPNSVVDIGCGIGTWLCIFKDKGVKNILGVDGDYIDLNLLQIERSEFISFDLSQPFVINERFDLAVCLELAEHLPESSSNILVDSLCKLSNKILFSAALPFQGGQNHLNEQPFEYWKIRFNNKGYLFRDIFRNEIWNDKRIEWWYRQNMFLIEKVSDGQVSQEHIHDYYHPEMFAAKSLKYNQINSSNKQLKNGEIPSSLLIKIITKSIIYNFKKIFH